MKTMEKMLTKEKNLSSLKKFLSSFNILSVKIRENQEVGESLYIQYHVTVNPMQICAMQYFSTDIQDLLLFFFKIKQNHK